MSFHHVTLSWSQTTRKLRLSFDDETPAAESTAKFELPTGLASLAELRLGRPSATLGGATTLDSTPVAFKASSKPPIITIS